MGRIPIRLPSWQFIWRDGGQSLVLVALSFSLLMAGGAMGIDVGRFYAERRFLQDAVDSAALACALNKTRGGTSATAWSAADVVLQNRLLLKNPLGIVVTYAARGSEGYDGGVVSDVNLNDGILPTSLGCRVAITVGVPTYLIKVLSPALNTISMTTRAYAKAKGGFLPSVVKRYLNIGDTDDNPTDDGGGFNEFIDTTAAEGFDSSCHAYSNYAPGCTPATTATPGREIVLFGASQKADNDSSFRGYIGLDVRNFEDANPPGSSNLLHDSYNLVPPNATVNTLKSFEATWIGEGYPGPDLCVVNTTNFDKCGQISVLDGSSSGVFVTSYDQWFQIGQIAMFQLYDGQVKSVPDFTFTTPTLTVPNNGTIPSKAVVFSMSTQFSLTASQVCSEIVPDNGSVTYGPGDTSGSNPFMNGSITYQSGSVTCTGIGVNDFSTNPTPVGVTSYTQTLANLTASGASQGIYEVFVKGSASAPYNSRIHWYPMKVNVSSQSTEYDISSSDGQQSVSTGALPLSVNFNMVVNTGSGSTQWHTSGGGADGLITVSWESCPRSDDLVPFVLTCYIGSPGTTSTTITAGNTQPMTVLTTGVVTQTTYTGWIRTSAVDHNGHPVVKLWPVRLDVDQQTGGTTSYVDVIGYAAYKITAMDSNDVYGRAVTAAYLDPNDQALSIAKRIVLVPWETNP